MTKTGLEYNQDGFPLTREAFSGPRVFGMPTAIYPSDDAKTTIGFVYQQVDETGKPKYITLQGKDGQVIQHPYYSEIKASKSIEPKVLKSLVFGIGLSEVIKKLFGSTQNILYICIGIAGLVGMVGFLVYNIHGQDVPQILNTINGVADICRNAVQQCQTNASQVMTQLN
jgi:hypothetical protein